MIRGLYTAASGMLSKQKKLNIVSNNLANVNNPGFKKDRGVQSSFKEELISRVETQQQSVPLGKIGNGVLLEDSFTDHSQGLIKKTGNVLDMAIEGSGFFVVQTPTGLKYTRNGNFTLNDSGQIVTHQGYQVMGEKGPLQTNNDGREISIDSEGRLYLGETEEDQILVVNFASNNLLQKEGENLFVAGEDLEETTANYQIHQGYLENSNVNIVKEMVNMIEINRHYEATQKVISTVDNTLDKAVNEVGRMG